MDQTVSRPLESAAALGERVLFVHAHPDDETITTGGTIATLVDAGASVTVVTCTRGEKGEVIPPDIAHLEGSGEPLAALRMAELDAALAALGVTDHRYLGARGARLADLPERRYVDSGMRWGADGPAGAAEPLDLLETDSFAAASFSEVAADIATIIADVQPTAVVSYDETGGYGHPDHRRARAAAAHAAELMGVPFFEIDRDDAKHRAKHGGISVDISAVLNRKTAALRAHRSQVTVSPEGDRFSLSSGPSRPIATVESFHRAAHRGGSAGETGTPWGEQGIAIRILAWIIALVVGASIGGILTVNHEFVATVGSFTAPVGIVIALVISAALLIGLRILFEGRSVAIVAAVGMIGTIGLLSFESAGGSVLVAANTSGYFLTYGPAVVAVVVLAWPTGGRVARDKIGSSSKPKGTPSP